MLLPVDVHDLLLRLAGDGWVWKKANILGCKIPNSDIGREWRQANVRLPLGSDGLLPEVNPDMLQVVTGRGSHTSSAIRCMNAGVKGWHEELCLDGYISKSKIIERQPSMQEPIDKGLKISTIKSELVEACPRLMEVISRTGNNNNNTVYRLQTTLQRCNRIHSVINALKCSGRPIDLKHVASLYRIGA